MLSLLFVYTGNHFQPHRSICDSRCAAVSESAVGGEAAVHCRVTLAGMHMCQLIVSDRVDKWKKGFCSMLFVAEREQILLLRLFLLVFI